MTKKETLIKFFKEKISKDSLTKYFKMNIKSFIVLIYLKTLRLYSLNILQIKYYNKSWLISVGSTLFSLTLNSMFGRDITNQVLKIYDKSENLNNATKETVITSLSIFYILFLKYIYMLVFFNKNIINNKYIQVTVISILSITFYTIVIKPLFKDSYFSNFMNSIISDTILLLSSDFIEDAEINSKRFDIEISTIGTFFRIILNSLIKI